MSEINLGRVVGKSAYEIACDYGFVGTEEEWIESLKSDNSEIFIINIVSMEEPTEEEPTKFHCTIDKSHEEILEAIKNNKLVVLKFSEVDENFSQIEAGFYTHLVLFYTNSIQTWDTSLDFFCVGKDGSIGILSLCDVNNENDTHLHMTSLFNPQELESSLSNKVDIVEGKGLSTNDFTTDEKNKLAELCNYDDTSLKATINQEIESRKQADTEIENSIDDKVNNAIAEIVANSPDDFDTLKEIADWIDTHEDSASAMNSAIQTNKTNLESEITNRKSADTTLQANIDKKVDKVSGKSLSTNDYTTTEKNKLAGIAEGANKITVDSTLSSSSTNPLQNKAIYIALSNKVDKNLENATGVLAVANGGTGKTTLRDSANVLLNGLDTGASVPADNDYYISQYADGGTTNTTYHRRPVSALWAYIKGKISSVLGLTDTSYNGTSAKATADSNGNNIVNTYATKTDIKHTSLTPTYKYTENKLRYYWFKIVDGSSLKSVNGRYLHLNIKASSDTNYPYKSEYVLDVSNYISDTYNSISVSLKNLYIDHKNYSNICVAIDDDFNVYLQIKAVWTSYCYIKKEIGNINILSTRLNYSDFGTDSDDFTSIQKVFDSGKFRITEKDGTKTIEAVTDVYSLGTANKATKDASGNDITNTYATKTEVSTLETKLNNKLDITGGTINGSLTVAEEFHCNYLFPQNDINNYIWIGSDKIKIRGEIVEINNIDVVSLIEELAELKATLGSLTTGVMPLNSTYMQYANEKEPSQLFGGTWTCFSSGDEPIKIWERTN